ncbi:hypothetical protein [Streptomyces sp. 2-1]|uniref:hypothetical protein n=1 Tax=Streptomyces sp. 2-1 TaxID=412710 RepID=UPI003AFA9B22|nr:hypothetical protein [Streptomyces phaeochromogenes]
MDQATSVVLASAVAGFSSAAGAALGSVIAGRTARDQIHHTAQHEKVTRHEVALAERFSCFKDKVNDAIGALRDIEHALIDDEPVSGRPAKKACAAVWTSYHDDVWSTGRREVILAANEVRRHLEDGLAAIEVLINNPNEAKAPDSESMRAWSSCLGRIGNAYQTTSRLMGEVIRGADL